MSHIFTSGRRASARNGVAALVLTATALLGLSACSGTESSLAGTTWGGVTGLEGKPSITFERDGSLSGSDGCNFLTGSWEENADTVTLDMEITLKYCEGVDTWLSTAEKAKLSGSELIFIGEDGKEVGKLTEFDG